MLFIGDDGYGLEPWLFTPLKHEIPGSPRYRYNEDLCSARSCVKRLFGEISIQMSVNTKTINVRA